MAGRRERGEAVCASLQPRCPVSAADLPVSNISVDGAICLAFVASGCAHCIVHAPYCAWWTRKRVDVMTVSGQRQRCKGVGRVQLRVCNGDSVVVDVYVVDFKPLGFDFILGINGISALGGVTIFPSLVTRFGSTKREEPVCASATTMEEPVCTGATKMEEPVCAGASKMEEPVCTGATKMEEPVCMGATKMEEPVCTGATKMEEPVCAGATKMEEPACAGATKMEKPVCAGATKMEKTVCTGGDAIDIDELAFCISFDASGRAWTVPWKWSDAAESDALRNRVTEYSIPASARLS